MFNQRSNEQLQLDSAAFNDKKIKCYKNFILHTAFHESKCTVKMSEIISTLYNLLINCSFKNVNLNIAEFKKYYSNWRGLKRNWVTILSRKRFDLSPVKTLRSINAKHQLASEFHQKYAIGSRCSPGRIENSIYPKCENSFPVLETGKKIIRHYH